LPIFWCQKFAKPNVIREKLPNAMGVRRGGQEGSLATTWLDKIVCFSTFLVEDSMILGIF